ESHRPCWTRRARHRGDRSGGRQHCRHQTGCMSVSKKKLPNAIIHPIDGMREAVAANRSREWRGALTATTASNQSPNGEAVSAPSGPRGEVIEKTQASAVPVTATSTRGARTFAETSL